MLKILRKKGLAKKIIWVIAIVIIISFGFFGTAYLLTGNGNINYAGRIFGKKVSIEDFNKIYQNVRLQAIRQYGANLDKVAHLLNLETQTWDRMILLHEANRRRIKIPNELVIQSIENDKSFEKNNQFDVLLYNTILRSLRIRPRDYEETVRDNLKIEELFSQITSSVTISEEEVFEEFKNLNEKVQVSYIYVPSDAFQEETDIDPSEINEYYENNKNEFLLPPSVSVQYITLNFPEPKEPGVQPESQTEKLNEDEKDKIREKAGEIFEQLLVNPNMSEIAVQNKLDIKTSGFFSREQPNLALGWPFELLNKIFEMAINEIHEPFETANGISIVQIKEKKVSYVPPLNKVQNKVREAVEKAKSKNIARQKASGYLAAIREVLNKSKIKDFANAAKEMQLEIHQTPVFNRGQYLPQVGISKQFQEAAFSLSETDNLSEVVETEKGYCILHLDNYVPADQNDFEKAREELAESISQEKRNSEFGSYVMQLRLEADLVSHIDQLRTQ